MKKFSIFLPMLALVFAVTLSAFTQKQKPNLSADNIVWQYEPGSNPGTDKPENYVKLDDTTPFQCEGTEMVCQIVAQEDGQSNQPDLHGEDPALLTEKYQTSFRDL